MPEAKITQQELFKFSRTTALLFNRVTTYSISHPYAKDAVEDFHQALEHVLESISPLLLILVHDQLAIDEEPMDPRINVSKIVGHFKKTGIQSISFEKGFDKNELKTFLEVITTIQKYPDAEAMKKALTTKGVRHVRINHVFFKKVTAEDEILSMETLKKLSPQIEEEAEQSSKKLLLDLVLESVLAEEFVQSLTVENIVKDPGEVSRNLIEADLICCRRDDSGERRPGNVLMHQLEILDQEVEKNLAGGEGTNLFEVASALFEMKRQLVQGVETNKSSDVVYADEEAILVKVNSITDRVFVQIVKDEYKGGKISVVRLGLVIRRLVPEPKELKRLLPLLKTALLEEGMSLSDYFKLLQELGKELEGEELARILQEAAEEVGIDGQSLIDELKANPEQAAELIFLAAEIRKGAGDERELTELLSEYVEKLGSKLTVDIAKQNRVEGDNQIRRIVTAIESSIVGRLKKLDFKEELVDRLEEKFSSRINELLDKVKLEWVRSQSSRAGEGTSGGRGDLSILQVLEQTVSGNEELGEILDIVRAKVESNEIDENDFGQIYGEIVNEQQRRLDAQNKLKMPVTVLQGPNLAFCLEKEMARARRYNTPLSALAFSVVKVQMKGQSTLDGFTSHMLMVAVYERLSKILRDSDIIAELGKNKVLGLLPMTPPVGARAALQRCLKLLHSTPVVTDGITLNLRVAGVMISFDTSSRATVKSFMDGIMMDLAHMEARIRNLQAFF